MMLGVHVMTHPLIILQDMKLTLQAAIKAGDINNVKCLIEVANTTVEDSVR